MRYLFVAIVIFIFLENSYADEGLRKQVKCYMDYINSFDKIRESRGEQEALGEILLDSFLSGAVVLDNGAKVEANCFKGKSDSERAKIVANLNTTFDIISKNSQKCQKHFGFKEVDKIPEILNRLVILCGKATGLAGAQMTVLVDAKKDGQPVTVTAALSADKFGYMMVLDKYYLDADPNLLSNFIGHEVFHVLRSNQREWHNEAAKRADNRCENSRYTDYVYLVSAACFPENSVGETFFFSGVNQCENVCMSALTEVDKRVVDDFGNFLGPSVVFEPYSPEEAKQVCDRLKTSNKDWYKSP